MSRWVVACLVVVAVMLGGELVYYMSQPAVIKVSFRSEDVGRVVPPPEVKKVVRPVVRPKVVAKPPVEGNVSVDVEAIPEPPRMVAVSPDEIKVGMKKADLRSSVGEPFMQSATTEDGQLMEVYVFPSKIRGQVTVAKLMNGQVVSAYTRVH